MRSRKTVWIDSLKCGPVNHSGTVNNVDVLHRAFFKVLQLDAVFWLEACLLSFQVAKVQCLYLAYTFIDLKGLYPSLSLLQEGQLSVTFERLCTKFQFNFLKKISCGYSFEAPCCSSLKVILSILAVTRKIMMLTISGKKFKHSALSTAKLSQGGLPRNSG